MKEIYEDITYWKANLNKMSEQGKDGPAKIAVGVLRGLKLALSRINKPSNKVDATSSEPCKACAVYNMRFEEYSFCPRCGEALNR